MLRIVLCIFFLAFAASNPVMAEGLTELKTPSETNTVQSIGIVPEKKPILLDLGGLRTGEAKLPGGNTTFEERMEIRRQLALKRQKAVEEAKRN